MNDEGNRRDVLIVCRDRRMGRGLLLLAEDNGLDAAWLPSADSSRIGSAAFLWADADDAPELTRLPEGFPAVLWTDKEVGDPAADGQAPAYPVLLHRPFDEERLIGLTRARPAASQMPSERLSTARMPDGSPTVDAPTADVPSVPLTPNEQKILDCLTAHKGTPVTRAALRALIGADAAGNMVDVYVSRLRDKLEKPNGVRLIVTVRGVGYMIQPSKSNTSSCQTGQNGV